MKFSKPLSRFNVVAIAVCCLACAGCNLNFTMVDGYVFDRTGETAEYSEQGTFADGVKTIKIENRFGNVKVSLADGEPGWTWNSKVWAESQELADQFIDELAMEVETNGDTQTWTVLLPAPSSDLNGVESHLTLKLPADVAAKIENRHGNVAVRNLATLVELENAHGDVDLKSLTGKVVAVNQHGDLMANQIAEGVFQNSHGDTQVEGSTSDITIKSSHGNVRAEQIQGTLTFEGSHGKLIADTSGSVIAKNSHGENTISTTGQNVQVASAHGDIHLTMLSGSFESIDLETSHSKIDVVLPASSHPAIAMDTTHGKMVSEFESDAGSSQRVNLKNQHGDIKVSRTEAIAEATE
jgi:hypothetical protein